MPQVKVYGTGWCHDTISTRRTLDELGVKYDYIDIEKHPDGAKWVRDQNNGKEKKPTVDIAGQILSVPDSDELQEALRAKNLIA